MRQTGEPPGSSSATMEAPPAKRALSVTFVLHAPVQQSGGRFVSGMASIRYRACLPGQVLADRGHRVRLLPAGTGTDANQAAAALDSDVVVIAKSFHKVTERLAAEARLRGAAVVVDLCDHHFDNPVLRDHQHRLVDLADVLVVSTPAMGQVVKQRTGRSSLVVPDPFEGPRGEPRFAPLADGPLQLVWFGHPVNLDTVTASLPSLIELSNRWPISLRMVTAPVQGLGERLAALSEKCRGRFHVALVPWSMETTWNELRGADMAIIPSLDDASKIVKSSNRIVECLRAGRFAVAHALPSYVPFGPYAWLDGSLAAGIEWAVNHPREVLERVRRGQERVERELAPECSAEGWQRAFHAAIATRDSGVKFGASSSSLTTRPASPVSPASVTAAAGTEAAAIGGPVRTTAEPVRLNLGCGDKILDGYVNVDLVESRLGRNPDVNCDVRRLEPFPDDSVDEVLAVHVAEHFWRWEIVGILEEWARVLKPGGRMVLECPNLLSACHEFIRNSDRGSGPGPEGERTMWVFYGDPRWKDPYMCHRWGYTPASLADVMREAGLTNVRQEPAQYKMREPRDMRIVGEKPVSEQTL